MTKERGQYPFPIIKSNANANTNYSYLHRSDPVVFSITWCYTVNSCTKP
ncbi:hypothetical protein Cassandra_0405 [Pseudomonas phage Cassandra]|nr:hypothetical protein Cassandra_0405 [Pseudomonas phage Cassandra]